MGIKKKIDIRINLKKLLLAFLLLSAFTWFCTNTQLGDLILEKPGFWDSSGSTWDGTKWGP